MDTSRASWAPILCSVALLLASAHLGGAALRAQAVDLETITDDVWSQRLRWFYEQRKASDGRIPVAARMRAMAEIRLAERGGLLKSVESNAIWQPLGPEPLRSLGVALSGRVTTIAAHPGSPQILYLGAAQGGVWKSIDGGSNWRPLTDDQPSLAMGALVIDPSDPDTLYAGTGEAHFSGDSYFGAGLLKSEDGGLNWNLLAEEIFTGASFADLLVDPENPNRLYAAVARGVAGALATFPPSFPEDGFGVYRSDDAGLTWRHVFGDANAHPFTFASDLVMDPTDAETLYVAFSGEGFTGSGVWKTRDGGDSWQRLQEGLPEGIRLRRGELAISSDGKVLLAGFQDDLAGGLAGLFKSIDRGATWQKLESTPQYCGTQCWYDHVLAIHPENSQILYAGGVGLYRSLDGGASWNSILGGANGVSLHVDQHALEFDPEGRLLVGNDGGVWVSDNPKAPSIDWTSLNASLNTIQMYPGLAQHATSDGLLLAGSQDNGCDLFSGDSEWERLGCGDGAFQAIDPEDPDRTWYISSQFLRIRKTTDAGETWTDATEGLPRDGTRILNAPFIATFELCPDDSEILIAGTTRVHRTENGASLWTDNSHHLGSPNSANEEISALAFVPGTDCRTYYAATRHGRLWKTSNGGAHWRQLVNQDDSWRGVSDLAVSPSNPQVLYATLTGFDPYGTVDHVLKSIDGGQVWTEIGEGLPDIPFNAIAVHPDDSETIYAGADVGLLLSTDGGSTWQLHDRNLPNVAIFDLEVHEATRRLRAATHGRGVWELELELEPSPCVVDETTVCFHDDRFEVRVDWLKPNGESGFGRPVFTESESSNLFWFFDPENWELMIKVLDGCSVNDRYWVLAAATTNVAYTLTVTDKHWGMTRSYVNPQGRASAAITHTQAFDTCP